MKTIKVAVAHEFTFRDDGQLVRVSPPLVTMERGWVGVIRDDPTGETLRTWDTGEPLKEEPTP